MVDKDTTIRILGYAKNVFYKTAIRALPLRTFADRLE